MVRQAQGRPALRRLIDAAPPCGVRFQADADLNRNAADLILIATATDSDEWIDRIAYLPI